MKNIPNKYTSESDNVNKCKWNRSYFDSYSNILAEFMSQEVIEKVPKGKTLLDLACGDGTITKIFKNHFSKIVGVDASKKHLQIAKNRLPDVEFHLSLIEEFEYPQKFDVITLLCVLEHVIDPVSILKKAASFLKKDGIMIVQVPNALACNRVIARIMGTLKDEYELSPFDINIAGHRRSYDIDLLKKDIIAANLSVKFTGGIFYKMLSMAQFDWFIKNGLWEEEFGWGRCGGPKKDWKYEFCKACYEYGKTKPNECNIIYACIQK